jgi:hypothetical protein
MSGYFDDPEKLVVEAAKLSGSAPAVYIRIRLIRSTRTCSPRASKRVSRARHGTSDADIRKRRWRLVDFDPKRPAGVSSTEEEHQAAIAMARRCRDFLRSLGWPESVVTDSGNGAHLLVMVDLPNATESSNLSRRVLEALGVRFNDGPVEIDLKTFTHRGSANFTGTLAANENSRF